MTSIMERIAEAEKQADAILEDASRTAREWITQAKSDADAKRIRAFLEKNPPSPLSRFYDFAIDTRGMAIEPLG